MPERPPLPDRIIVASFDDLEEVLPVEREFRYNETEARRLGLERLDIPAYPEAQRLIEQVIDKSIDITTPAGQKQFLDSWKAACPDLPPPCLPDNFWYLTQLANGKIVSSLEQPTALVPDFGTPEVILSETWKEEDWNAPTATTSHTSPLLKELLGNESTVYIQRQDLDAALWVGDPGERIPTEKHKEIIQTLGVDPAQFMLRPITQDEYARSASIKGWGQKNLWTNMDGYYLEDAGERNGLGGGSRGSGGASNIAFNSRGNANGFLAVRLVLEPRH